MAGRQSRDCYENKQMCDKAADNYLVALKVFPDCYITQKMCDKAISTYHYSIYFVYERYKTQEMYDEAGNRCFLA